MYRIYLPIILYTCTCYLYRRQTRDVNFVPIQKTAITVILGCNVKMQRPGRVA